MQTETVWLQNGNGEKFFVTVGTEAHRVLVANGAEAFEPEPKPTISIVAEVEGLPETENAENEPRKRGRPPVKK